MDQTSQRLMTSPQIWIYFLTASCTTILTIGMYFVMPSLWQSSKKQGHVAATGPIDNIPHNLQRGYTDIEKNSGGSGT